MKNTNDVINEIFKARDRYFEIKETIDPSNESSYLLELMDIRKEISCLSLDLAKKTGTYLREFKKASSLLNTKRYLELQRLMDEEKQKVTAAESKAKAFVVDYVKAESQWEADYMYCKIILGQVNEVLASIKQDISIIKRDYEGMNEREN